MSLYARFFNKYIDPSVLIKRSKNSSSKQDVVKLSKSSSSKSSSKSSSSSNKQDVVKLNPYCNKDAQDPITQDSIHELGDKDRKYVVSIFTYDVKKKKAHYYCFDTIEIYNYILECIKNIKEEGLINLNTNTKLTDDDLDEICNKIKFLTNKPTYNSHVDIKEAINKRLPIRIKEVNKYLEFLDKIEGGMKWVIEKLQELEAKEEKLEAEAIRNRGFEILQSIKQELKQELNQESEYAIKKMTEGLERDVERLRELKEIETRNKKLERDVEKLQKIIRNEGLEELNKKLIFYSLEYNEFEIYAFRLLKLQEEYTYNNYLQLSLGEGIKYEQNSEEYKRIDIIGEYNCYISINLGNMRLPIINSILADNIDNKVSYLENKKNSFIIRLPIFKDITKNDVVLRYMQKIGKELGKLGEHDYKFPYRENNRKLVDLPPFYFGMNEEAEEVFVRFQKYIKIKTDIKYIRRITDIQNTDIQNNFNII